MTSFQPLYQTSADKVSTLQKSFVNHSVDGYLVLKSDPHRCEYLPPFAERLKWLTDFSGSAGLSLILKNQAILFVDGRYRLQASYEVDKNIFEIVDTTFVSPFKWISQNLSSNLKIGVDSWLISTKDFENYQKFLNDSGSLLVTLEENLIDKIWYDQPKIINKEIVIHPLVYSGLDHQNKIKNIAEKLKEKKAEFLFISSLESVNWLFNIRGRDLKYIPVVTGFAIISQHGSAYLFTAVDKVTEEIKEHLGKNVQIYPYTEILNFLKDQSQKNIRFWIDPQQTAFKISTTISKAGGELIQDQDPILIMKACKNDVEIQGMRDTHLKDGVALLRFMFWLTQEIHERPVSEIEASNYLHQCRSEISSFITESFPTISASGAHGAIIHYQSDPAYNHLVDLYSLYLVDSGGHYKNGSTDVTRTFNFLDSPAEIKDRFTRVLKGHIALAQAVFPQGTTGAHLDLLARQYLWEVGLDYAHGTGHGVGSVLNIHEGPQSIGKALNQTPLYEGMILSNEPGYYKEGHYGIRIESLMVVVSKEIQGADHPMLGFDILTLSPIDITLIDKDLMTESECNWLNKYHKKVYDALKSHVDEQTLIWLEEKTEFVFK